MVQGTSATSCLCLFCRPHEISVWPMIPSGSPLLKHMPRVFKPSLLSQVLPQVASQELRVEIMSMVTSGLKFRREGGDRRPISSPSVKQVLAPATHIPSCRGILTCSNRYDFNTRSSTQAVAPHNALAAQRIKLQKADLFPNQESQPTGQRLSGDRVSWLSEKSPYHTDVIPSCCTCLPSCKTSRQGCA